MKKACRLPSPPTGWPSGECPKWAGYEASGWVRDGLVMSAPGTPRAGPASGGAATGVGPASAAHTRSIGAGDSKKGNPPSLHYSRPFSASERHERLLFIL